MSDPAPIHVKRVRVATEAAFGTDQTNNLAVFRDVPLAEETGRPMLRQETINAAEALQTHLDYQRLVLGKKDWELSFTVALAPTGTAAGNGAASITTSSALHLILSTCMGGVWVGEGSVADGAWATAGGGDVVDPSGFRAGGIAGHVSGGRSHWSPVKEVDGDTLSLAARFPSAPASGDVIYSGTTYFFVSDPKGSMQLIVEGENPRQRWVLLGGQCTVEPSLPLDGEETQTLTLSFVGTSWLHASDALGSANLVDLPLEQATYDDWDPISGHAGQLLVKTNGVIALTGASIPVHDVSFEFGMTLQQITSPDGVEGVFRHRLIRAPGEAPVSGSISTFFSDEAPWTQKGSRVPLRVFYRNGVTPGHVIAMEAPTVQVTEPALDDADNIDGVSIAWMGRADRDSVPAVAATAGAVAMARSPVRIHRA